jgi:hypothetical protein
MNRRILLAAAILALGLPAAALAQTPVPTIVTPDKVAWTPGTGPYAGVDLAVLVGDPTKAGPYTVRVRIPDGGKLPPHTHADTERVTVISGTLLVGLGDTMNAATMTALPAKGETIVQIGGNGPMTMTAVGAAK